MLTSKEIFDERKKRSERLTQLRKSSGLTQEELSKRSGLSRVTIREIEKNNRCWSIDTEILYISALQVTCS